MQDIQLPESNKILFITEEDRRICYDNVKNVYDYVCRHGCLTEIERALFDVMEILSSKAQLTIFNEWISSPLPLTDRKSDAISDEC